jgi:hypothetical protein
MTNDRTILITGVTGKGGAVAHIVTKRTRAKQTQVKI